MTALPDSLIKPLRVQLVTAKQLHEQDLVDGYGTVRFACPMLWNGGFPYGEERWSSGTLPTDYRFTGQREEAYRNFERWNMVEAPPFMDG